MRFLAGVLLMSAALVTTQPALAQSSDELARIVDEGMNRSHAMLNASELMDRIGPRLTNSPNMHKAEDWAIAKFRSYGLANVHKEPFDFGRGWEIEDCSVRMVSPRPLQLTAIPVAWSPPTNGAIRAPIVVAPINRKEQLAAYHGKLAGKIVLISLPGEGSEPSEAPFKRLSSEDIAKLDKYEQPTFDPTQTAGFLKRIELARDIDTFLAQEGALAAVRISYRDGKLLSGEGYDHQVGHTPKVPFIELAAEDYRRLARLAKTGDAPILEINSNVRFFDGDTHANNIIADIPGTDPKAGYVMAGAHFDSWTAGDGAADNGAGSIIVMEAARILKQLGIRPKRTIRFALWEGEEQGLFGSLNYVNQHIARRPYQVGEDGIQNYVQWSTSFPITPLPGYRDLKAYFNVDNGSGKLRGIYAEGNAGAVPLLHQWLEPFASMGAGAVVAEPTGGTDHVFFESVGIPGFQFIQDPLDYESRVHHSNIDTLDHVKGDDMRQAAIVMAGMLLEAADSDKVLPPLPVPSQPLVTDPFKYDYPEPK